jgi:amino acid permease
MNHNPKPSPEEPEKVLLLTQNDFDLKLTKKNTNRRSWIRRTFSPVKQGALRGNIFLLIITTTGSVFFYIPYYGKKTGLILLSAMLLVAGALSFYSSHLLYYAFKATKAKTYDECVAKTMGKFWGFFSNIFVFAHCWGAMLSSWIFAYEFLLSVFQELMGDLSVKGEHVYTYVFFGVTFGIIFLSTIFGNLDKLKFIAAWGLIIIIYILIVLFSKMPEYFQYYNQLDVFQVESYNFNLFFFKSWGMCQYIFLNQYTIVPICNNIKKVTSKRLEKVVRRTTVLLCFLYIAILFIGYFSQPSLQLVDALPELFILRPPIPGTNDLPVLIGKLCFVFSLMVAVMIKTQFFLLYFWQIFNNLKQIFKKKDDDDLDNGNKINKRKMSMKSTITQRMLRCSEDSIQIKSRDFDHFSGKKKNSLPRNINETVSIENIQEENLLNVNTPNKEEEQIESENEEIPVPTPAPVEMTRTAAICLHLKNLLILFFVTILTIILKDSLSTVLSILGNFVGIFELTIFPFCMTLIINRRVKIISNLNVFFIYFIMILFALFGLASFILTFFVKDKVH